MNETWMTVKAAANYLAVHQQSIYNAIDSGTLRHSRLSGKRSIRIRREWLDEWMEHHATGTEAGTEAVDNTESAFRSTSV